MAQKCFEIVLNQWPVIDFVGLNNLTARDFFIALIEGWACPRFFFLHAEKKKETRRRKKYEKIQQ